MTTGGEQLEPTSTEDADQVAMLERWLHDFDVKQAALTARQDAFLLKLRKSARHGAADLKNA